MALAAAMRCVPATVAAAFFAGAAIVFFAGAAIVFFTGAATTLPVRCVPVRTCSSAPSLKFERRRCQQVEALIQEALRWAPASGTGS